jgi:hypothetical protein
MTTDTIENAGKAERTRGVSTLEKMSVLMLIWRYIPFVAATALSIVIYERKNLTEIQESALILSQVAFAVAGIAGFFKSRR